MVISHATRYGGGSRMCDTLVALSSATASGDVLFGKNSDREFNEAHYLEQHARAEHAAGTSLRLTHREIPQARLTNAVLLSKPHWIWGAEMGANEYGLAIGNEAIFSRIEASLEPGIIGMDYVRLALERARSVDEAVDVITTLLRRYGQSGQSGFKRVMSYHNSYLIADTAGGAVLETVDREWVLRRARDVCAISNVISIQSTFDVCSQSLALRADELGAVQDQGPLSFKAVFEDAPKVLSGTYRRARTIELLGEARGRLREADIFRILRDHREGPPIEGRPGGPRICMHHRDSPLGHTTGSWVSHLRKGRVVHWVTATAAPCTSVFKPLLAVGPLPAHGSRPGAGEDSTSLWWRHEQLRQRLERTSDAQLTEFNAERDSLETEFLARVNVEQSSEGLRNVIVHCWKDAIDFEDRWLMRVRSTGE